MIGGDYEDDTHYCLKCHSTIIGLDNYVQHRKCNCGRISTSNIQSQEAVPNLKADDFFSSLELQSSSKKSQSHSGTSGGKFPGILTRSKTSAVLHATNQKEPTTSKDIESERDDESDSELEYEDSDESVEENANAPPRSYTGGKWKPTSSPIQWLGHQNDDERYWTTSIGSKWEQENNVPPATFTGSKWTPGKSYVKDDDIPPTNHTKGKWKPRNYESDSSDQKPELSPPANYTKGKWKPGFSATNAGGKHLAPTYTKGKWKPGCNEIKSSLSKSNRRAQVSDGDGDGDEGSEISPLRKSNGFVQYWCGPCNRRLASKVVYDRHVKSELHFKRTKHDRELNESSCLNIDFTNSNCDQTIKDDENETKNEKGKTRKKIYEQCKVCKSRVNMQAIGKHLISHYHCLKSANSQEMNKIMILNNIHSIVLQSPFQCGTCKFYCNTEQVFTNHWIENHQNVTLPSGKLFSCSFCKFETNKGSELYQHLVSKQHRELISLINRSVPIVIKQIIQIECATCMETFLLNIQLRKHCEKENHPYSSTSTNDYQSKFNCTICNIICKSLIALQRHHGVEHDAKSYVCTFCSLVFNTAAEIKVHRNSTVHRCNVLAKHTQDATKSKDLSKSCLYCKEKCANQFKLKEHLAEKHPEHNHSCCWCGESFVIPQELTVHLRKKACTFSNVKKSHSCNQCQFTTDSISELLYHNALHNEPLVTNEETKTLQYKCPMCEKLFSKTSLRCHIRIHTQERPYVCTTCGVSFVRKNNWFFHMRNHRRKHLEKQNQSNQSDEQRPFLCSTCGASFKKRSILQQHMMRHTGKKFKCKEENCVFEGRSLSELKSHQSTHSDEKVFGCHSCDYRGKTKQQLFRHFSVHEQVKKYKCAQCSRSFRLASHLRRHELLHRKSKSFSCRYCDYQCNDFENLRKHVLNTQKHPGKSIYECNLCSKDTFQTNLSKDFKVHLLNIHGERFPNGKEATTYINGMYGGEVLDSRDSKDTKKMVSQEQHLYETSVTSTVPAPTMFLMSSSQDFTEDFFLMSEGSGDVVCIENLESWSMEDTYDVEETEPLPPFQAEGASLFDEHFQ